MRNWGLWRVGVVVLCAAVLISGGSIAMAVTSSSQNYQMTEAEFGAVSSKRMCSNGEYCAQVTMGDMAAGDSHAGQSKAEFGNVVEGEPLLEVIVAPGESDLGVLSTDDTAKKVTTVHIRHYITGGYNLVVTGTPPKYSSHTLGAPATPTLSQPGTEQFAINVAKNTIPGVGELPVQVPAGGTAFGVVNDNYKLANQFMYKNGDVIAHSTTESGETIYTISMIVNIANTTPAGHYMGDFSAVVVPVF